MLAIITPVAGVVRAQAEPAESGGRETGRAARRGGAGGPELESSGTPALLAGPGGAMETLAL